jgi:hypothetical protein
MSRSLRHFLPLEVDPALATATFTGDAERWLPGARHVGPDRFTIEVGTDAIERPVTVTIGMPWHVGSTWWRSCSWEPIALGGEATPVARLLPSLDAELGLAVRDGRATLLLDGRYDPPGGGSVRRSMRSRSAASPGSPSNGSSPAWRAGSARRSWWGTTRADPSAQRDPPAHLGAAPRGGRDHLEAAAAGRRPVLEVAEPEAAGPFGDAADPVVPDDEP